MKYMLITIVILFGGWYYINTQPTHNEFLDNYMANQPQSDESDYVGESNDIVPIDKSLSEYDKDTSVDTINEYDDQILKNRNSKGKAKVSDKEFKINYSIYDESPSSFSCDGRTRCTQMHSCEEAKYFLANCKGVVMDGDGDGIPCESQWCNSGIY
jgi:hypothetical protein